jgi:hypothetical protein
LVFAFFSLGYPAFGAKKGRDLIGHGPLGIQRKLSASGTVRLLRDGLHHAALDGCNFAAQDAQLQHLATTPLVDSNGSEKRVKIDALHAILLATGIQQFIECGEFKGQALCQFTTAERFEGYRRQELLIDHGRALRNEANGKDHQLDQPFQAGAASVAGNAALIQASLKKVTVLSKNRDIAFNTLLNGRQVGLASGMKLRSRRIDAFEGREAGLERFVDDWMHGSLFVTSVI